MPVSSQVDATCKKCQMRDSVLFADLTDDDFNRFKVPVDNLVLPKGTILYGQGQPAAAMFTIRDGLIKLEQSLADGSCRIVSLLRPGDIVGLETSVAQDYEHSAVALLPSKLCRIPRQTVEQFSSQISAQLMGKWHSMMKRSHQCALELSTGSAKQRMARLFLILSHSQSETFQLFSREDVGALLGITTETASRMVSSFKRQNVIVDLGNNVFTYDAALLHQIADGH